jgi:hypothetical protein
MADSFRSVPDSKLFGKTFSRTKDRSGPQSGPSKKTARATDTSPAPSPITQGSANKTRNVINKSPAAAEAEFSSINRMFAEIDASELDLELTKKAKPKGGAKSPDAQEETGSGRAGSVKAKPARGKAKESKGVTKSKSPKRKSKRSA